MGQESQRVDFDVREFRRLIEEKGLLFDHWKAYLCPCQSRGTPLPNCSDCNGTGWKYKLNKTIKGVISGIGRTVAIAEYGMDWIGTASFTTYAENRLAYRDRLVLKDGKVVFCEILTIPQKPRYPVLEVEVAETDTKQLQLDTDFTIYNEQIVWGRSVSEGTVLTIRYITYPVWLVLDFPNVLRGTFVKFKSTTVNYTELPLRAMIKLEWRVRLEGV